MKNVSFFEVEVTGDREGKSTKVLARFTTQPHAAKFAGSVWGQDMYDQPGTVRERNFTIYTNHEEAIKAARQQTREKALSKLTQRERDVLSFTDTRGR